MILELGNKSTDLYGDAKLIKKDSVHDFKYKTVTARSFMFEDPIDGFRVVKATQSILTNADLKFAMGDKIKLDISDKEFTIVNITKEINEKQLSLLNKKYSVKYILDLA